MYFGIIKHGHHYKTGASFALCNYWNATQSAVPNKTSSAAVVPQPGRAATKIQGMWQQLCPPMFSQLDHHMLCCSAWGHWTERLTHSTATTVGYSYLERLNPDSPDESRTFFTWIWRSAVWQLYAAHCSSEFSQFSPSVNLEPRNAR